MTEVEELFNRGTIFILQSENKNEMCETVD